MSTENTSTEITLFAKKADCCGCGACALVCPKGAIRMEPDAEGFIYPVIDSDKCVRCRRCEKVCSFKLRSDENPEPIAVYAAASKDEQILNGSASGGIFPELAKLVLKQGGVVFGCAYDEKWVTNHIEINSIDELKLLQGSKYVQSKLGGVFIKVKSRLDEGLTVLFSGTPCQVGSLRIYLGRDYPNLYCVDLVCHGVGSPAMFADEIKRICGEKTPVEIKFRGKEKGWGTSGRIVTDGKQYKFDSIHSPYYYYYLACSIFRDSCYNCRYASEKRQGDITLGDYWRIETAHPGIEKNINVSKGVSCVLVNTEKGQRIMELAKPNLVSIQSNYEFARVRNGQLRNCCTKPVQHDEIFQIYEHGGYKKIYKSWRRKTFFKRLRLRTIEMVPANIKRFVKRKLKL